MSPLREVTYGLYHMQKELFVVPRSDGILVQVHAAGDFGNADEAPRRAESEAAVNEVAKLFGDSASTRAAPTAR